MAISTSEVVFVLLLAVGLIAAIWVYIVTSKHTKNISSDPYSRGANAHGPSTVNLVCDDNSQICVYNAVQVCTNPNQSNFEDSIVDGMTKQGSFDPTTTADLTQDMINACNGKSTCAYTFTGDKPFGYVAGDTTIIPSSTTCSSATGGAGVSQLISTYTCAPKGKSCADMGM